MWNAYLGDHSVMFGSWGRLLDGPLILGLGLENLGEGRYNIRVVLIPGVERVTSPWFSFNSSGTYKGGFLSARVKTIYVSKPFLLS